MFEKLFGLAQSPFALTPDPTRFVPTSTHNEALSALYYGIRWHKGFVVVTGEVGTGKTLLLRCLINQLKDSEDLKYAYIFNSRLSPTEFLQYVLSEFGLDVEGKNKTEMLLEFRRFLTARGAKGLTTGLIVDEAHQLSGDLLEEIRLLSNFETTNDKLLQILLVGQPELDEKLDSYGLRQLKQRIAVRAHIGSLSQDETAEYIMRRLESAGFNGEASLLFPPETSAAVYRYSRGLPRLINTICENALLAAYAQKLTSVAVSNVEDAVSELRLDAGYFGDAVVDTAKSGSNKGDAEIPGNPVATASAGVTGQPLAKMEIAPKGGPSEPNF